MPVLDAPVLQRPDGDREHSVLVRLLGSMWYMEHGTQYAYAFELPGEVQHWWSLAGGVYGRSVCEEGSGEDAPTPPLDVRCMSMEERRELIRAVEERLQKLEDE